DTGPEIAVIFLLIDRGAVSVKYCKGVDSTLYACDSQFIIQSIRIGGHDLRRCETILVVFGNSSAALGHTAVGISDDYLICSIGQTADKYGGRSRRFVGPGIRIRFCRTLYFGLGGTSISTIGWSGHYAVDHRIRFGYSDCGLVFISFPGGAFHAVVTRSYILDGLGIITGTPAIRIWFGT